LLNTRYENSETARKEIYEEVLVHMFSYRWFIILGRALHASMQWYSREKTIIVGDRVRTRF
jgi:hypothetical protein